MTQATIITHFSVPTWPVVNKLRGICKCLDVAMVHCPTVDSLLETIKNRSLGRALIFADEGLLDLIRDVEKMKVPQLEVAMFVFSALPSLYEKLNSLSVLKYIIGMQSPDAYGRDLSILIKKFTDGDILDLDKYLAFGCKIHSREITTTKMKREAIDSVVNYVSKLGDPGYNHPFDEYAGRMAELVDELLLNAVFDANPRMKNVDRSKPFTLNDEEKVLVSWSYDGEYFGVSVRDPFGKFRSETIMKYLAMNKTADELIAAPSGGLGLKFIFERAHQVITNVRSDRVTEVIALVRFANRLREFDSQQKSFYFFG